MNLDYFNVRRELLFSASVKKKRPTRLCSVFQRVPLSRRWTFKPGFIPGRTSRAIHNPTLPRSPICQGTIEVEVEVEVYFHNNTVCFTQNSCVESGKKAALMQLD